MAQDQINRNENFIQQMERYFDNRAFYQSGSLNYLINEFPDVQTEPINYAKFRDICAAFLRQSELSVVLETLKQRMESNEIQIYLRNRLELRNELFLLHFVLANYPNNLLISQSTQVTIANYQIAVLNSGRENADSCEVFIWALAGLERLIQHVGVNLNLDDSAAKRLALECFDQITDLIWVFEMLNRGSPDWSDYNFVTRDKVIFCLKWFKKVLLDFPLAESPLKIVDGISASGNTTIKSIFNYVVNDWTTTIASHAVTQGVYYFETSCIGLEIVAGYCTRKSDHQGIGKDKHSIGLDLSKWSIWHNSRNLISVNSDSLKNDDVNVIGVLLDCTNGLVIFYLNGELIQAETFPFCHGDGEAYYPTVSLGFQQHCKLIFDNFEYVGTLPEQYQEAVRAQEADVELLVPQFLVEHGIYKHAYFDYPCTFPNDFGVAFSSWIKETYVSFNIDQEGCITELRCLLSEPDALIPFLKAIIVLETIDETIDESIFHSIWRCLFNVQLGDIELNVKCAKIIELILHYTRQNTSEAKICFAILTVVNLRQLKPAIVKSFWDKLKPFLNGVIFECENMQSRMLAILCMKKFALLNDQIKRELTTVGFLSRLMRESAILNGADQSPNTGNAVQYRLALCAKHLHQKLLQSNSTNTRTPHSNLCFNPDDMHERVKISPNLQFARYDEPFEYGNVLTNKKFGSDVQSFKITLLSNAPVRVGFFLKTNNMTLNQYIGLGDINGSIAYCGSEGSIRHNGQILSIYNKTYTPVAGSEIECQLNFNTRKATFFLNGAEVHYYGNVDLSIGTYIPAVTLESFSQVYLHPFDRTLA